MYARCARRQLAVYQLYFVFDAGRFRNILKIKFQRVREKSGSCWSLCARFGIARAVRPCVKEAHTLTSQITTSPGWKWSDIYHTTSLTGVGCTFSSTFKPHTNLYCSFDIFLAYFLTDLTLSLKELLYYHCITFFLYIKGTWQYVVKDLQMHHHDDDNLEDHGQSKIYQQYMMILISSIKS